jgi:uncharacterized protein
LCKSLWLLFASVLFAMPQAHAVSVPDLYEVATPVTTTRDAAFVDALKTVVVRVSGRRDAAERLGTALNNPRQYVQRFGFTSDNVLQAAFDSRSVDRLLNDAGLPTWGRERPATLVLVSLEAPDGSSTWMDASTVAPERDAITIVAKQRGVPLVWPQMDAQDRIQTSAIVGNPSAAALLQMAARYGANAVLLGRARRDGAGGAFVRWTLAANDNLQESQGAIDAGIHMAADSFASVYSASGSTLDSVALEVSGIGNLNDYATTLNYLENMTVVRSVALEQVAGDTLHFKLAVRGDAAQLKRALALDNKLVPQLSTADPGATERLQFRYQP